MKKRAWLALLLCLALLSLLGSPAAAAAQEPEIRHIATVEDLKKLAEDCRLDSFSRGLQVVLDADLDLSGEEIYPIPTFGGSFDGGGHRISGLRLKTDGSHQGLFRYIQESGSVKDLRLSGSIAPETGRCQIGGLAGVNYGSISSCSFEGSVSGLNDVGGLVGRNYGTIWDCTASGTVDGKRMTGGIAGCNEGLIADCRNEARVNTTLSENAIQLEDLQVAALTMAELTNAEDENVVSDSGGIVGFSKGVVRGCRNLADIGYPHFGYNVGGIAGRQSGYLTACENWGQIYGRKDVGGVVGQMEPYLLLKESVNLADELNLLNEKMNRASGTLSDMSDEMQLAVDQIDQGSNSAAGKIVGGGSIGSIDEGQDDETGGSIGPAGGELTDQDIQDGLDYLDDNTNMDTDDITVPEGISGDVNDIAGGMARIYRVLADNTGELSDDLTDVNDQLSRVLMLMANALNGAANRQIFEDVSDELKEEDLEGRVSHCANLGNVDGDRNVGGVVGTMGIEYEFDMEGELVEAIGIEGIVSNTYETRCISSDNENHGAVLGKKDRIGGIAGTEELGSILRCEGYGAVNSNEGGYVGGVVGCSYSVVRQSYAMCNLSGCEYVGGIAGYGTTVVDCCSLVGMGDVTACSGAIAGWADMEGEAVTGNVFVHESLGAVDGISYSGKAAPLSYEELLQREDLPEQFHTLHLSFMADGALVGEIAFEYGGSIDAGSIPAVPEKEGYTGAWPDYDYSALYYSAVIEAIYTPREGALAARQTREDSPMAIVLIEGDFDKSTEVLLSAFQGEGPEAAGEILEKWVVHLSRLEEGQSYSLRYLPPELERGHHTEIYVLKDGEWSRIDTGTAGSYLSFACSDSTVVFCAVDEKSIGSGLYFAVGVSAAALLGLGLVLTRRKKKKPVKAEQSEA